MSAGTLRNPTTSPPERTGTGFRPWELAGAALVAVALGLAYIPTFTFLGGLWASDPNYSHGYFVIPIALAILWMRAPSLDRARLAPSLAGWVLLLGVVALRAYFYQVNQPWLEDATIPLALVGLALAFGGWPLLRWSLPAIAFLVFMYPLPNRVNAILAYPLQRLATISSCAVLEGMGLPALAEGNVIVIGGKTLEVARACNGLSMLLSFLTLVTAAAILFVTELWERVVLLASAIPIALVSNILRITITALCFAFFGTDELKLPMGRHLPHDWAGYLMMPMALVLMWLELRVLSWLVVAEEPPAPAPTFEPGGVLASARPARPTGSAGT